MSQTNADLELMRRIQAHDEQAFHELFQKYYQMLCYHGFKTYPDEHKVKDFAQDVFVNFWKKRMDLDIHVSVQAYLRRAVTNKAIDYIRSQRFNFEAIPEKQVSSVDQIAEFNELETLIHKTMETLPEKCRMVFFLSRFEGLKHKEIAEKLGISSKTIENQMTKALKILRKAVEQYKLDSMVIFIIFYSLIGDLYA